MTQPHTLHPGPGPHLSLPILMTVSLLGCTADPSGSGKTGGFKEVEKTEAVTITVDYGSEKKSWMEEMV